MAQYWLSPHQYLEGSIFGLLFALLFIQVNTISRKLKIETFGFGKSILINTGIYFLGFIIIIFLVYLIIGSLGYYGNVRFSLFVLDKNFIGLIVSVLSIIIFQILFLNYVLKSIEIMGDYNLLRFLTGKYRTPVIENRAFMFLDLRSSTRHAEKLGNVMYSSMIRDCFRDLNYLLNKFEAEIYQYVGDEIVLTWHTPLAVQNQNIFGIYFGFQEALQNRSDHYFSKYGIIPEFKAGCNSGEVSATEIGIIKKDIAFHGDVINTASRVQDMCNPLKQNLLSTPTLIDQINLSESYNFESVGHHNLKGKTGVSELYSVKKVD